MSKYIINSRRFYTYRNIFENKLDCWSDARSCGDKRRVTFNYTKIKSIAESHLCAFHNYNSKNKSKRCYLIPIYPCCWNYFSLSSHLSSCLISSKQIWKQQMFNVFLKNFRVIHTFYQFNAISYQFALKTSYGYLSK